MFCFGAQCTQTFFALNFLLFFFSLFLSWRNSNMGKGLGYYPSQVLRLVCLKILRYDFGNLSISNQHSNICVFFANRSLKVPQSVRSGSPGSSFLRRSLSDFAPVCFISSLCLRHQCINIKGSGQKLEIDGMWKNSTLGGSRRVVKTKDHTFSGFFFGTLP